MITCLYQDMDDECEMFYDLDNDERHVLYCTQEGECCIEDPDLEECPFFVAVWR